MRINIAKNCGRVTEEIKQLENEMEMLNHAIETLEDTSSAIMKEHYIGKTTYEKIGRMLGYSKATIYKRTKNLIIFLESVLQ